MQVASDQKNLSNKFSGFRSASLKNRGSDYTETDPLMTLTHKHMHINRKPKREAINIEIYTNMHINKHINIYKNTYS